MADITELCEQVDQVGLHQLIVLDGAAQDVWGRLKEDVPHEEYIEVIESLGRLNQCMLMWCQRLLPMAHTCNYYCSGTVHGFTVLVPPDVPEASRTAVFHAIAADMGWTLLAFRPAPETDVATAMRLATYGAYVLEGLVVRCPPEGMAAERPKLPYLALVETAPVGAHP